MSALRTALGLAKLGADLVSAAILVRLSHVAYNAGVGPARSTQARAEESVSEAPPEPTPSRAMSLMSAAQWCLDVTDERERYVWCVGHVSQSSIPRERLGAAAFETPAHALAWLLARELRLWHSSVWHRPGAHLRLVHVPEGEPNDYDGRCVMVVRLDSGGL